MASSHLNWLIVRDHNAFLLKRRDIRKPFSTEPGNLTNLSSFRYSGLVHHKTITITPAEKKGVNFVYNRKKVLNKPAKAPVKVTLKEGPRRTLKKIANMMKANRYRADLRGAALRRASAILRSQRPTKTRKGKAGAAPAAATAAAAGTAAAAAPKKAE
ncbi:AGAP005427-PA [Anopheles gambiae str. PEST]|uniref:Large ribosomal subunit protein eL28 n=2 Tax=gambiae species complex TaxID=44542 RepID=Q7PP83_ANOGA|nr:60S ribosomal protein L28 [Anopheles coluzzii]XP_315433.4 large ribosomal subunit protein eL28 [Anopheles gambiae]EAA10888.5 AGAP005427-PA [Anopheles gambiae str. PEST]